MKETDSHRRWPWFQQILDAGAATIGLGIAVSMAYRNSYPIAGIALIALCIGKITASGLLRILLGRWDAKP